MGLAGLELLAAVPFSVRVKTNNRLHLRYEISGRTVDDGRCGIDNNWVKVSETEIMDADPDRLCRYCFPESTGDKEDKE